MARRYTQRQALIDLGLDPENAPDCPDLVEEIEAVEFGGAHHHQHTEGETPACLMDRLTSS